MKNIIIFSSIDWEDNWQVHQELSLYFRKKGDRVLFVENTGSRRVSKIIDFSRIARRIKNFYRSLGGFRSLDNGVLLFTPVVAPFPNSKSFSKINEFFVLPKIKQWLSQIPIEKTIAITFLPTPLNYNIIKKINPTLKIFYYADSMSKSSKYTKYLEKWENRNIEKSDMVFTSSQKLFQEIKKRTKSLFYFQAGLKNIFYRNIAKKTHQRKYFIGYVGSLSEVVDILLIIKIAKKYPNKKILILGPVYKNISSLRQYKNIEIEPQKNFPEILDYYKNIQIGIVPYKKNSYTRTVFPTKLNEYLISGSAVISTDIFEVNHFNKKFKKIINVAKNHSEFLKLIEKERKMEKYSTNPASAARLKKYLETCRWENKFDIMNQLINRKLLEKSITRIDIMDILKQRLSSTSSFLVKAAFFLTLIFLVINNGFIIALISKPLQKFSMVRNVESLFVLSGSSADFESRDMRIRSLETAQKYKDGIVENIILNSGNYSGLIEIDSIIYRLGRLGVDKEKIGVLKSPQLPKNTYESVKLIKEYVEKKEIKNFAVITHPYHSLRLSLTFKNLEMKAVIFDNSNSIDFNKTTLDQKFNLIRIIIHEYLALIHNYLYNRI